MGAGGCAAGLSGPLKTWAAFSEQGVSGPGGWRELRQMGWEGEWWRSGGYLPCAFWAGWALITGMLGGPVDRDPGEG